MRKHAFTLVEIVAVMVILAILVAVAAPKMLETSHGAGDAAIRADLRVLRDAIERYVAANGGTLPGEAATEADLKDDLRPYVQRFPENPLNRSSRVYVQSSGTPFTGQQSGGYGWLYDTTTGDIRANSNGTSQDGITRYYEF